MSAEREFHIILWGATGFTGRLVAAYLSQKKILKGESFSWAIAGRDKKKLEEVRASLLPEFEGEVVSILFSQRSI